MSTVLNTVSRCFRNRIPGYPTAPSLPALLLVFPLLFAAITVKLDAQDCPFDFDLVPMGLLESGGLPIQAGSYPVPELVDIDADGDLDLFVGDRSTDRIAFYRNTGDATNPQFTLEDPTYFSIWVNDSPAPSFCDIDADGDYDLFIGYEYHIPGGTGGIEFWRNVGTAANASFQAETIIYPNLPNVAGVGKPALVDIDYDGDFDINVGIRYGGAFPTTSFDGIRNDGSATSPVWGDVFALIGVGGDASSGYAGLYPTFADVDCDGDLDILCSSTSHQLFYRNVVPFSFSVRYVLESRNYKCLKPFFSTNNYGNVPILKDFNGDNVLDIIVGVGSGNDIHGVPVLPGQLAYFQGVAVGDQDGDGLSDVAELTPVDLDCDGIDDLNLPAMGANYLHKDLFIEIDWMEAGPGETESHKPKDEALDIVTEAFANAPVTNPDGIPGINVHFDLGQGGPFNGGDALPHDEMLTFLFDDFYEIKTSNFDMKRSRVFHYCIFGHAHSSSTSSGYSISTPYNVPSFDLVVTLGGWASNPGTVEQQAGTLLHELGHNLGLDHGGDEMANYKPNYLSVMNYFFQASGVYANGSWGNFDLSRYTLGDLDESALEEAAGISGGPGVPALGSSYSCGAPIDRRNIADIGAAIDWDCDGNASGAGAVADINGDGSLTILGGAHDWDNLIFDGRPATAKGTSKSPRPDRDFADELTEETYVEFCRRRGDADNSGSITVSDAVFVIGYIFAGGAAPTYAADADADSSELVTISDAVFLISYIFGGGPEPGCY